jgi:enediyne biosynthesis protein E3
MIGWLKSSALSLSPEEASFSRRGFPGRESASRAHLEEILRTFIQGYNLALRSTNAAALVRQIDSAFSPVSAGFAYEGAGLWFALSDLLLPRAESRLRQFLSSAASHHDFIASVGAGFAIARAPFGLRRMKAYQAKLDPMSAWCLADGYGFHQGFFHWERFVRNGEAPPASLDAQSRALFDAGVGRSMWWVFGADPVSITAAISRCESHRRAEMWTGIGTALSYAGGMPASSIPTLLDLAGPYRTDLISGILFSAHMRHKGGNPSEWTDRVCAQCLGQTTERTSAVIVNELQTYLDSWTGSEQEKWDGCYLALRSRVKRVLAACDSAAANAVATGASTSGESNVHSN